MAANNDIMLPGRVDVGKITYSVPRDNRNNGGKTIFLLYDGKPLMIQTPEMAAPFGISMFPGERGAPDRYHIDLSFNNMETKPTVKAFFDFLKTLNERVVTDAMENSSLWLKKRYPTREVVDALCTPLIHFSRDRDTNEINNTFPPRFKVSLPCRDDGNFTFPTFDGKRAADGSYNQINLRDIVNSDSRGKGARVSAIIQCSLWVAAGKFGVTWKAQQLRVVEEIRIRGYAFRPMEDDTFVEPVSSSTNAVAALGGGGGGGGGGSVGFAFDEQNRDDDLDPLYS